MSSLLILDFSGVCTRSASEIIARPEEPTARAEAVNLVREARASGIVSVILSNEIDPGWTRDYPIMAAVDHIVSCEDNHIYKPDRRAFQRCLLLSGHSAEQALVVDDDIENVTAAKALGMETVLFDTAAPDESWQAVRAWLVARI